MFGVLVSKGFCKLHELDSVYGTQDVYDMLEIVAVDAYNERITNAQTK